jgi:nucleoside 2-deoxyribosyltransferase
MTDVQTIYIAGPMSGYKNFNYDAFNAAAEVLREAGYRVLNPAEFDGGGQDDSFHNYMRKDLSIIIAEADALVCLQDWETSAGAKNEVTVARAIGVPVWDISTFASISNNPKDEDTWAVDHPETPQQPQQVWMNAPGTATLTAGGDFHWTFDAGKWSASPVEAYTESWSDGLPIAAEPEVESYVADNQQPEEFSDYGPELPVTSILEDAEAAVNGPRQRDYDHPLDNFARIAGMWSYLFECQQCKQPVQITEEQHALAMILVKVARLMHSPNHRDSQVDLAGYAATIEKLQRERVRRDQEALLRLLADVEQWQATLVGNSAV